MPEFDDDDPTSSDEPTGLVDDSPDESAPDDATGSIGPIPPDAPDAAPPPPPMPEPVSARRLEANRRNAQRSTGPITVAGKERVSRNALKHGIYADVRPIEQGTFREDPLAVDAMVDGVLDALKPRNPMERAAAIRIAKVMLQIGRYHAMETLDLEQMTRSHEFLHLAGPGLFEARYNAEFYADVADTLTREPGTYTMADWHDLLLAGAAFDEDLRKLYGLLDLDDPDTLADSHQTIILTIAQRFGGSLPNASKFFAQFAQAQANTLPDATKERDAATRGIRFAQAQGRYESHTRALSRLSAALDREIKRYERLRNMTDQASTQPDDDDEPEMYDDWDYDNPR